jgi:hypothetical protein
VRALAAERADRVAEADAVTASICARAHQGNDTISTGGHSKGVPSQQNTHTAFDRRGGALDSREVTRRGLGAVDGAGLGLEAAFRAGLAGYKRSQARREKRDVGYAAKAGKSKFRRN